MDLLVCKEVVRTYKTGFGGKLVGLSMLCFWSYSMVLYLTASTSCGSCIGIYLNLAFKNGSLVISLGSDNGIDR